MEQNKEKHFSHRKHSFFYSRYRKQRDLQLISSSKIPWPKTSIKTRFSPKEIIDFQQIIKTMERKPTEDELDEDNCIKNKSNYLSQIKEQRNFTSRASFYIERKFTWPIHSDHVYIPVPLRPKVRTAEEMFDLNDLDNNQSDIESINEENQHSYITTPSSIIGVKKKVIKKGRPPLNEIKQEFSLSDNNNIDDIDENDNDSVKLKELDEELISLLNGPEYSCYSEDFTLDPNPSSQIIKEKELDNIFKNKQKRGGRKMPLAVGGASSIENHHIISTDNKIHNYVTRAPSFTNNGLRLPINMIQVLHHRPPANIPRGASFFEPLSYEITRSARKRLRKRKFLFDPDFDDLASNDTTEHVISIAKSLFSCMARPHVNAISNVNKNFVCSWRDVLAAAVRSGKFEKNILDEVKSKMECLSEEVSDQLSKKNI